MAYRKLFSLYLIPSVVNGLINFLMIPVITLILGPKDIGFFALISTISMIGNAIPALGSVYILAANFPALSVRFFQDCATGYP